jgi:thiamine monophosphate synthase
VKVFPSKRTCPRNDLLWGIEGLREIRSISSHRIVAIGGLTTKDAERIYRKLYLEDGIAMAGGLMNEEDPKKTAQRVRSICQQVRGQS